MKRINYRERLKRSRPSRKLREKTGPFGTPDQSIWSSRRGNGVSTADADNFMHKLPQIDRIFSSQETHEAFLEDFESKRFLPFE